jgi:hypothetical protein
LIKKKKVHGFFVIFLMERVNDIEKSVMIAYIINFSRACTAMAGGDPNKAKLFDKEHSTDFYFQYFRII